MSDVPPTDGAEGLGELPAGIEPITIQAEMEDSFLQYAMSVIISRALPDARDGLKPVHRRILWSMFDSGHRPDRSHVKCATVVGDVIGRFHPHGDTADLRLARANGSDVLPSSHPDRSPRQLRVARRSARRLPLHRVSAHPVGHAAPGRHRRRHGRLQGKLRRQTRRAGGAAEPVPQPAGQRQPGHRGGHGHQHPAPQPRRDGRRHHPPDRQPRRHAR